MASMRSRRDIPEPAPRACRQCNATQAGAWMAAADNGLAEGAGRRHGFLGRVSGTTDRSLAYGHSRREYVTAQDSMTAVGANSLWPDSVLATIEAAVPRRVPRRRRPLFVRLWSRW